MPKHRPQTLHLALGDALCATALSTLIRNSWAYICYIRQVAWEARHSHGGGHLKAYGPDQSI